MKRSELIPMLGTFAVVASASGQWSYHQPWRLQRDSHESRVLSCADPMPLNLVAADDWEADEDVRIRHVTWWGVLTNADAQEQSIHFRIAIASDDPNQCVPLAVLFERCVEPHRAYVGTDCDGRPVYRFWSRLPGGFVQTAGNRYWLSIAEIEEGSPTQGVDFRWSGHRRPKHCDAVQIAAGGAITTPLASVCDERTNDLSFVLRGRALLGAVAPVSEAGPRTGLLQIRHIDSDALLESLAIQISAEGQFLADPTVPDGLYRAVLLVTGSAPEMQTIMLSSETPTDTEWELNTGDVDGDGVIGFLDLLMILSNWTP